MKAQRISAFLLVLAISLATVVHPLSACAGANVNIADEPQLTPEEAQEVRDVAALFNERLQETNDFGLIIDEMFVGDFSERLRRAPTDSLPWYFLDKSIIANADGNELRRYYVAIMSFYGLIFRLDEVSEYLKRQQGDDGEIKAKDVLSPEIISVLFSDPTLAEIVKDLKKEDENESEQEIERNQSAKSVDSAQTASTAAQADSADTTEAGENGTIKSLAELVAVSATLEKANKLLGQHLASVPLITDVQPSSYTTKGEQDSVKPHLHSMDEDGYGYTKNTLILCAHAPPFYMYLVRVKGQLKILSVSIFVQD